MEELNNYIQNSIVRLDITVNDISEILELDSEIIKNCDNDKEQNIILNKISTLLNIPLSKLLKTVNEEKQQYIKKIVITGGPCAGKSTAMELIQKSFSSKGYSVIFIKETATELINKGIDQKTCKSIKNFQTQVLKRQIKKEKVFSLITRIIDNSKILIVCDRGALDGKAFIAEQDFKDIANSINIKEEELYKEYDAIFHLVTAANGAKEFYTLSNNTARIETFEEAIEQDNRLIEIWSKHNYFKVIDNSSGFNYKMQRLINEITTFLNKK